MIWGFYFFLGFILGAMLGALGLLFRLRFDTPYRIKVLKWLGYEE